MQKVPNMGPVENPCPAKGWKCNVCGKLNQDWNFRPYVQEFRRQIWNEEETRVNEQVDDRERSSDGSTWAVNRMQTPNRGHSPRSSLLTRKLGWWLPPHRHTAWSTNKCTNDSLEDSLQVARNTVNGYVGNTIRIDGKFRMQMDLKHAHTKFWLLRLQQRSIRMFTELINRKISSCWKSILASRFHLPSNTAKCNSTPNNVVCLFPTSHLTYMYCVFSLPLFVSPLIEFTTLSFHHRHGTLV